MDVFRALRKITCTPTGRHAYSPIGGGAPSIADMRLAATLEFLRAVDYAMPAWAETYMTAMEASLGDAYTEPAADVRGFIQSVKGNS